MRAVVLLLALGAVLAAVAQGAASVAFDHDRHAVANQQAGLTCLSCHQLAGGKAQLSQSREEMCHACHHPAGQGGAPGPQACPLCHPPQAEPAAEPATPPPAPGTAATAASAEPEPAAAAPVPLPPPAEPVEAAEAGPDAASGATAAAGGESASQVVQQEASEQEGPADEPAAPAAEPAVPSPILARFDHDLHGPANERAELSCTACHSMGAEKDPATGEYVTVVELELPVRDMCHLCHHLEAERPVRAPRKCGLCHDSDALPVSHGAGWTAGHGSDARLDESSCRSCHKQRFCIDCHERKEALRYQVHDRSWPVVHGIASFSDPAACGTCHLQADCVACHSAADGRRP